MGDSNDDDNNAHGLGNNYYINVTTGIVIKSGTEVEIANIQNCSYDSCRKKNIIVQVTDHGSEYQSGPAYKCYAIYFSKDAERFLTPRKKLKLEVKECCE